VEDVASPMNDFSYTVAAAAASSSSS